jgi:hypothetical protein
MRVQMRMRRHQSKAEKSTNEERKKEGKPPGHWKKNKEMKEGKVTWKGGKWKNGVRAEDRARAEKGTGEEKQDDGEHMACGKRGEKNEVVVETQQEGLYDTTWLFSFQTWK